jgi:hypothetical protein
MEALRRSARRRREGEAVAGAGAPQATPPQGRLVVAWSGGRGGDIAERTMGAFTVESATAGALYEADDVVDKARPVGLRAPGSMWEQPRGM